MPLQVELHDDGSEFMQLVRKCYKEKPDKKDLRGLEAQLIESPELFKKVFNLSAAVRISLITAISANEPSKEALRANIRIMREDLGFEQSPILEKMLIESVILTWLRYQWTEYQVTELMGGNSSYEHSKHWDRKLTEAQKRYLRAVEMLAKVRKMALPAVQVNIASEGGQQVNIAGDLVRPGAR